MNEWKKLSEEIPPQDTPVWAGWFEVDGSFTSGLFVLADDGIDIIWCRCECAISYGNFGAWESDDNYPVSHWMYLPKPPENQE
jgi:hypothetical protein